MRKFSWIISKPRKDWNVRVFSKLALETSYNKVMKDLADQTQAKLDLEQSNKRLKA